MNRELYYCEEEKIKELLMYRKIIKVEEDNAVLMQAEPNGIYTNGVTSSATWILMVDEEGNIKPTYVESEITVTQVKMDSRLCEDWSLTKDYDEMPEKAEIDGEVDTSVMDEAKEEVENMGNESEQA